MVLEAAAIWLVEEVGGSLYNAATRRLLEHMGLSSPTLTPSKMSVLLDDYYRRLVLRLDEDRIVELKTAIEQLRMASRTKLKQGALQDAFNRFNKITQFPKQGQTGEFTNAQLRCLAYLGIAAILLEIRDSPGVIAENLVEAVYADAATAKEWLGDTVVDNLLNGFPLQGNMPKSMREQSPLPPPLQSSGVPTDPVAQPVGTILYSYNHIDSDNHHSPKSFHLRNLVWSPDGKRIAFGASIPGVHRAQERTSGTERSRTSVKTGVPIAPCIWDITAKQSKILGIRTFFARPFPPFPTEGKVFICDAPSFSPVVAAWSPDSIHLAYAAASIVKVRTFHEVTQSDFPPYMGHSFEISAIAWSPDGRLVASIDTRGVLHVWDIHTGQADILKPQYHCREWNRLRWSSYGLFRMSGGKHFYHRNDFDDYGGYFDVEIENISEGKDDGGFNVMSKNSRRGRAEEQLRVLAWSPDGRYIVVNHRNESAVHIWDVVTKSSVSSYNNFPGSEQLRCVAWSPDSKRIAIASDKQIQIGDAFTGKKVSTCREFKVLEMAWSPNSTCIASTDNDGIVRIWQAV